LTTSRISMTKKSESAKLRKKSTGTSLALSKAAERLMGKLTSSENSLNQHIKLKHPDLWDKLKNVDLNQPQQIFEEKNGNNSPRKGSLNNNEIIF
jgi:hypothetical protein